VAAAVSPAEVPAVAAASPVDANIRA
jgi:hypothetical protein